MKMELGRMVTFSRHWVKNQAGVDPEDTDGTFDYQKLIPVEVLPCVGIIVGKRSLGTVSHLQYHEDREYVFGLRGGPDNSGWVCYKTTSEPFYLVACNLSRFYKVKESDLLPQ